MILALVSAVLVLAASGEPTKVAAAAAKLQTAQAEFKGGEFQRALRTLDAAASQPAPDRLLSEIHLLRGQCFAALQDFPAAEVAFGKALEHDPEASLDPAKVDPKVVRMVDNLRLVMQGDLRVRTRPTGASVKLDGKPLGAAPVRASVPIGRHSLEASAQGGKKSALEEVVIHSLRVTEVDLALKEGGTTPKVDAPAAPSSARSPYRPFGDLRTVLAPGSSHDVFGFEVGGGFEYEFLRASLHANLYPSFGLTPRAALSVPVVDPTHVYVSVEVPFLFSSPFAFGLGGAGGVEYRFTRVVGAFAEIGVRHFFTGTPPDADPNRLIIEAGLRLRIP
jgi:hypothetical protein